MRGMKGYTVPILTSFHEDGSIDEEAMRQNISYLIEEGIHAITLTGSFGEYPLLSSQERIRLFEISVEAAAGRCTIIAGTAHANTEKVIYLSQAAEDVGADGVMIIPPYYLLPSERDLKHHFRRIEASINLPVSIYNNPPRTGVNMSVPLLVELSQMEKVVTIKQSSKSFFELLELIRQTQDRKDFHVTNGQEMWAFPALLMGAQACYGISPLLFGRECIALYDCAQQGDVLGGQAIQYRINQIRSVLSGLSATPAAALRYLANLRGLAGGYSRAPITELSQEEQQILAQMSERVGLEPVYRPA